MHKIPECDRLQCRKITVLIRTPMIEDPRYSFIMQEHLIF